MTSLAMTTVAGYAYGAGFRGADLVTAVAVAQAESGCDPLAHNGNVSTGDNSFGLWQINFLGHLLAPRLRLFHIASPNAAYDPAINARCAYTLYRLAGNGFHDWSTYNHGSHKPFIDDASRAVAQWLHDHVVSPGHTPGPSSRPTFRRYLFLRHPFMDGTTHGDHDVQAWQHIIGATPDGVFGPQTDALTRKWQAHHKDRSGHPLHVDGIVGPETAASAGCNFIVPPK